MRPARLATITLAATLLGPSITGCGRGAPSATTREPPSKAVRSALTYKLVGVVRGVDASKRTVTIRHDAIPGFMPAMTMPFTLKDRSAFEDLREGDEVEGDLRVDQVNGETIDYELTGLVVARPAPAPPITLRLTPDGNAELSATPKVLGPGDEAPDFTMTTQDGAGLRLSALRGNVVVLTFIYTRCPLPNFCPLMDRKFAELADRISAVPRRAEQVRLLSVSFDPEHDTPAVLREHAKMRGARPPLWTFAAASHPELARVAKPLGLTYGPTKDEVVHNLSTAVVGPDGRLVRLEAGGRWEAGDLLKTIYSQIPDPK